jgi:hypothetical protein
MVTFLMYTGIGADKSFLHTKKRFLHIMKKVKPFCDFISLQVGEPIVNPNTFDEWVELSGAEIYHRNKLPEGYYIDNHKIKEGAPPPSAVRRPPPAVRRPPPSTDAAPPSTDAAPPSEECPICLEPMVAGKIRVLPCAHKGCSKCMNRWMRTAGRRACCPICRTDI